MEEKLINIKTAAELLGVSPATLRNWDRDGVFKPVLTYGNHRRYKMSDILTFQKEGKNGKT